MSSRAIRPRPLNFNERLPVIFLNRPRDEEDDDTPEVEPALEEYLRNCEEEREREHALLSGLDSTRARKKNRLSLKKHQQLIDTTARSPPGKRHGTPRNGLPPEAEPAAPPIAVPSCREVEDYDQNERAMAQADAWRVAEAGPSVPLVGILLGTSPSLTTLGSLSMDAASAYIIYQDVVRDQRAQPALMQYDVDEADEKALAEMRKGGGGGSSAKGGTAVKAAAAAAAAAAATMDERTFEGLIGALEHAHFNALQQRKDLWQETVKAGKVPKLPATEKILPFDAAAAELKEQQPLLPALPRALYNHWVKRRKQEGGPLLQYLWFEQPWKAICFREREAGKEDVQGDMPFEATETKNSTRGGWNRLRIDKDEAYDRLLEVRNEFELLRTLADQVRKRERLKKQLHKLYRAEMASKLGFSIHGKHASTAAAAAGTGADGAAAAAGGAACHSAEKKAGGGKAAKAPSAFAVSAAAAAAEPPSKRRKLDADQGAPKADAGQQRKQAKGALAEEEQPQSQPEKGRRGQGRRGGRAAVEEPPPAPEPESSQEDEEEGKQEVAAAGRAGTRGRGRQAPPPQPPRRSCRGKVESSSEDAEEEGEEDAEQDEEEEAEPSSSVSSELESEDTSSEEADLKVAASAQRDLGRRWALAQQRTGRARNIIEESDGSDSSEPSTSGSEGEDEHPGLAMTRGRRSLPSSRRESLASAQVTGRRGPAPVSASVPRGRRAAGGLNARADPPSESEPEEDNDTQEEEEQEEEEPKTTRRQSQRRQAAAVQPPRSGGRQPLSAADAPATAGGRRGRPRTRARSASASASLSPSPDASASPSRSSSPTRSDRGGPSSSSPELSRSPSSSPPPRGKRRGAGAGRPAAASAASGRAGRQVAARLEQAARGGAAAAAAAPLSAKQVRFATREPAAAHAPKTAAGRHGGQQPGPKGRAAAAATGSKGAAQRADVLVRGLRELQGLFKTSGVTEEELLRADQHPGRGSPANTARKAHAVAKLPAEGPLAAARGQQQQQQQQGQQQQPVQQRPVKGQAGRHATAAQAREGPAPKHGAQQNSARGRPGAAKEVAAASSEGAAASKAPGGGANAAARPSPVSGPQATKHPGISPNRKHRTLLRRLASTLVPNFFQRPLFTRHSKTSAGPGAGAAAAAAGPSPKPQAGAREPQQQQQQRKESPANAKAAAAERARQVLKSAAKRARGDVPVNKLRRGQAAKEQAGGPGVRKKTKVGWQRELAALVGSNAAADVDSPAGGRPASAPDGAAVASGSQRPGPAANKQKAALSQKVTQPGPKPAAAAAAEQLRKVRDGGVSKVAARKGRPLLRDRNGLVAQGPVGGKNPGKAKAKGVGRIKA
ncbi:hypothetical protein HYH02_010500 [Chlamydomonas schloesseri]|uniref:Enhancer of polycomb-like protein n=1 Tax=Chlamydomonas schloesseri TaxID=2026947 RepID=A0A835W591_9CHLO|nr:hypothetical protein HYH02_010500 [Chlamydomonas schloesseri]|eukprot:KAG2439870.1 hypothetical protein HYH02_010500 [Chlamydomonas schloesseri]